MSPDDHHRAAGRRVLAVVATLVVALAGCGDATEEPASTAASTVPAPSPTAAPSPTPTPTTSPTPSPSPPPGPRPEPSPEPSPTPTPEPTPSPTPSPTPKPLPEPEYRTGVEPVRLEIPAIGVDAAVVDLAIGPGDPEVPDAWEDAGWYTTTRNPGEIGPAVIAGHIDSKSGPAVFYRLDELEPGDEVIVHGEDDERTFVVRDSGQYPKEDLPDEVFGYGDRVPELRLITCGGSFDSSVGHYVDNLVVYASAQDA